MRDEGDKGWMSLANLLDSRDILGQADALVDGEGWVVLDISQDFWLAEV